MKIEEMAPPWICDICDTENSTGWETCYGCGTYPGEDWEQIESIKEIERQGLEAAFQHYLRGIEA